MFKNNITRIIFCAVAVLLFLVPSLYSKMKPVSEEDLDRVIAQEGVTLGLDINARATADSFGMWQNFNKYEGLSIASLFITKKLDDKDHNTSNPGPNVPYNGLTWNDFPLEEPFRVRTDVNIDVGTSGGRTWLNMSGLNFPDYTGNVSSSTNNYAAPNAVSVYGWNLQAKDSATTTYTLAYNVFLYGMYIGKNVNLWDGATGYVNFTPGDTFMRVSNHSTASSSGIDIVGEMGMMMRYLMIRPNTSDTRRWFADGIIVYGNTPGGYDATADPASWPNLSGSAKIGGLIPTYTNYYSFNTRLGGTNDVDAKFDLRPQANWKQTAATIDVGRSSGGETAIRMDLPMAMSVNWKHLYIDQGGTGAKNLDTGPTLLQNVSVYKAQLTIRDIY